MAEQDWDELDELIKAMITEQVNSIPTPDINEQWKLFQQRLEQRRRRRSLIRKIAVAAVVVLLLGSTLAINQTARADSVKEVIVNFINQTIIGPMHNLIMQQQPPDRHNVPPSTITVSKPFDTTSLGEAFQQAGRPFWVPMAAPAGLRLDKITVIRPGNGYLNIVLLYTKGSEYYSLTETYAEKSGGNSILYDSDDSRVSRTKVGNADAILVANNKQGVYALEWYADNWSFNADSNLTLEETIRVSSNLKITNVAG